MTSDMQQERLLQQMGRIVETMSGMVVIVDPALNITWANHAWEQRTGWSLATVRGQPLARLVCRGQDAAVAISAAMARGEAWQGESLNADATGARYWADLSVLPLLDSDGQPSGFAVLETDITVRKNAQAQARQLADEAERSRSRLTNALEALPDGVIVWDDEDRLVVVNSAYKRMYPTLTDVLVIGVTQQHVLAVGVERNAFPNAIGRKKAWLAEQYALFLKGNVDDVALADGRWIRRLDLRTADGGCITVRIETTERHRHLKALDAANRALAEARRSTNQIIESANVGTWEWNLEDDALQTGGCYAQMLGYAPEDLGESRTTTFVDLLHPEDMARVDACEEADFAHPPDGEEPMREHYLRMRRKDGSWAWILSRSAVSERHADGRHKRVVGVHLDVTKHKHLEDEIAASQAFLAGIMDASISAILVRDTTGKLTYANAEAERILRADRSTMERFNASDWSITEPDGTPMPVEALPFQRALATGEPVRDVRLSFALPGGTRRILSVNAVPHRDLTNSGLPPRIIMSFIDITEDLAKAARLELALEQAQAANRSKSNFLANMSHEIRTPLNGVLGMAELLDDMITEPRKKGMIGTIRQSGELLLNVLNEVLDMSKIEAGKMVIEKIAFTPAEIARQIEPVHSLRAQEKGLILTISASPGAESARLGDPFRLQQVLNNLLSNALKFTERGAVALTLTASDDAALRIEVRDTGIGMTPEQVGRIFDNFEQADGGTTRRFGGTGLGMPIVRSLITLMGGEISVTSSPGNGTVVQVSLPLELASEAPAAAVPAPVEVASGALSGFRLLVADDSATNRIVLKEMLKSSGATIVLATDGAEAVREWQRLEAAGTPADLLLLDIAMPVMDGLDALAAIRASDAAGRCVPAIAVTANAMSHQVAEYLMAGFASHVSKPFRRPDLLKAISVLLRQA
ncbi:MAG: PAS domain S-box protein [Pararhodobacter sp.]